MIYGLYLSATGVLTSSYRQDVIANNLANVETVGFKRNIANFQQRLTESQARGRPDLSNQLMDHIGGGLLCSPTQVDTTQGDLEVTGSNFDAAIQGKGYFAVDDHGTTKLTRAGHFMVNQDGSLVLANSSGQKVLDRDKKPITVDTQTVTGAEIGADGSINVNGKTVAKIGVFDIPDETKLVKQGGQLMTYDGLEKDATASTSELRGGFVERANVDPASELVTLMDAQRQLEANANMIRYQDQSLQKLVNDVGRAG